MIPYIGITAIDLGPVPIQVWGLLVAIGILVGTHLSARRAQRLGQDPKLIWDMASWIIIAAFAGARLFHVLLYEPSYYAANPAQILAVWNGGFSVAGGLIAAGATAVWYLRKRNLDVWAYADTAVFGLPAGLAIGRIGCFLIHDHPGTATDFILGVQHPDGVVRHDLGLYQAVSGAVLFSVFLAMARRNLASGWYLAVFLVYYGATRFALDFLRAADGAIVDTRYFGLTPAQYAALGMVAGGGYLIYARLLSRRRDDRRAN